MEYIFSTIKTDASSIFEITKLLRLTFPKEDKYTEEFITWQYAQNPIAPMFGFNAYHNGLIAAHYALMPIKANLFGKEEKGLLSLNTATHPLHRGKKLFPILAHMSYEAAASEGYSYIIGIANALSTSGFLKKLDFNLIGPLDAKIGIGSLYKNDVTQNISFHRLWDADSLLWRISNPSLSYQQHHKMILGKTGYFGIKAVLSQNLFPLVPNDMLEYSEVPSLKLYLGKDDSINWKRSLYTSIPKKLRPSPLNFIFKDLTGLNRSLHPSEVLFEAIDFDAY